MWERGKEVVICVLKALKNEDVCVCVCVCMSICERERERARGRDVLVQGAI